MLVFSIYPASKKIVKISTVTFNSANMDDKQKLCHQHDSFLSAARSRCNCPCQAKIIETPVQTILFIADLHNSADHVGSKDLSKFLKHSQRHMIASAVKVAPLQSPGELIRNVQNSQTKEIDAALRKSVVRLVRKETRKINSTSRIRSCPTRIHLVITRRRGRNFVVKK